MLTLLFTSSILSPGLPLIMSDCVDRRFAPGEHRSTCILLCIRVAPHIFSCLLCRPRRACMLLTLFRPCSHRACRLPWVPHALPLGTGFTLISRHLSLYKIGVSWYVTYLAELTVSSAPSRLNAVVSREFRSHCPTSLCRLLMSEALSASLALDRSRCCRPLCSPREITSMCTTRLRS